MTFSSAGPHRAGPATEPALFRMRGTGLGDRSGERLGGKFRRGGGPQRLLHPNSFGQRVSGRPGVRFGGGPSRSMSCR